MASRRQSDPASLLTAARDGDRGATARLLSLIEGGGEQARAIGRLAHRLGGQATTIGMTGAPGAGKSTLASGLVGVVRGTGDRVAVLAIDPSSPFTGGAILGDRVRMGDHTLDDGVFIRSMATRGHLGGLTLATPEAIRLLDALDYPWVVVETVGVGQVEVEVAGAADTTVVVVNPGWGDSVQANKAGLMEIADIFVVNKADRPGADDTRRDLDQMLDLGIDRSDGWRPPIVETVAVKGEGADELWSAIRSHGEHLDATGERSRRRGGRLREELVNIAAELLHERASRLRSSEQLEAMRVEVEARRIDPWTAAERLLDE